MFKDLDTVLGLMVSPKTKYTVNVILLVSYKLCTGEWEFKGGEVSGVKGRLVSNTIKDSDNIGTVIDNNKNLILLFSKGAGINSVIDRVIEIEELYLDGIESKLNDARNKDSISNLILEYDQVISSFYLAIEKINCFKYFV